MLVVGAATARSTGWMPTALLVLPDAAANTTVGGVTYNWLAEAIGWARSPGGVTSSSLFPLPGVDAPRPKPQQPKPTPGRLGPVGTGLGPEERPPGSRSRLPAWCERRSAVRPPPDRNRCPPALETARADQTAGVIVPHGYGGHAAGQPRHVHRRGAVHGRRVPQLTELVVPPTLETARGCYSAGVKASRRDDGHAAG